MPGRKKPAVPAAARHFVPNGPQGASWANGAAALFFLLTNHFVVAQPGRTRLRNRAFAHQGWEQGALAAALRHGAVQTLFGVAVRPLDVLAQYRAAYPEQVRQALSHSTEKFGGSGFQPQADHIRRNWAFEMERQYRDVDQLASGWVGGLLADPALGMAMDQPVAARLLTRELSRVIRHQTAAGLSIGQHHRGLGLLAWALLRAPRFPLSAVPQPRQDRLDL